MRFNGQDFWDFAAAMKVQRICNDAGADGSTCGKLIVGTLQKVHSDPLGPMGSLREPYQKWEWILKTAGEASQAVPGLGGIVGHIEKAAANVVELAEQRRVANARPGAAFATASDEASMQQTLEDEAHGDFLALRGAAVAGDTGAVAGVETVYGPTLQAHFADVGNQIIQETPLSGP